MQIVMEPKDWTLSRVEGTHWETSTVSKVAALAKVDRSEGQEIPHEAAAVCGEKCCSPNAYIDFCEPANLQIQSRRVFMIHIRLVHLFDQLVLAAVWQ